jgi:hypothetical protein
MHYDNPIAYWKSYSYNETHGVLARLAVRVFEAIANSVTSERAFSTMNLIHSKLRSKIGAEKANKLIYIYMNQRVLDRNNSLFLWDPLEKTAEEQVQLEDILLDLLHKDQSDDEGDEGNEGNDEGDDEGDDEGNNDGSDDEDEDENEDSITVQ